MNPTSSQPFQTILVGIDFSPYSQLVVKQARELAKNMKARLHLVHAVSMPKNLPLFTGAREPVQYSKRYLSRVKTEARTFYKIGVSEPVDISIEIGSADKVVIATAKKCPSPLIVIGSQGRSAVSRFILGSEAEKIALRSSFPVWVHRGEKIVPLHDVLVPTDLSSKSQKFIALLEKWTQPLSIVPRYIFVEPQVVPLLDYEAFQLMTEDIKKRSIDAIHRFLRKSPKVPISMISGGSPSYSITELGKKYDVIAMNPHSRSKVFKSFGRTTAQVIRLADNPVLVVKT